MNQSTINEIASTHLGKKGGEGYKDQYDKSLLVRIPRSLNREVYQISNDKLPFVGVDVWNAYEVSALTENGFPVTGILKIRYSSDSEYHVESKSLKLYLNSYNMTKIGKTVKDVESEIESRVGADLQALLETDVSVNFFTEGDVVQSEGFEGYVRIQSLIPNLDDIQFTSYKSDASQLQSSNINGVLRLEIDFLRSNCRVTYQPDWGKLYLYIRSHNLPDVTSIAKYVVSHRTISHFHEEVVEMVYKHFMDGFNPEELMVCALYTRRGGIDINPIRASHIDLIPSFMTSEDVLMRKTLMQ